MKHRRKIIIVLLTTIVVSLMVALFMLPNKVLFAVLSGITVLGLIAYYFFSGSNGSADTAGSGKFSNILIPDDLNNYFINKKPYLDVNFTISDVEKQLKVTRSSINFYIKRKYRRNFRQFVNLWRISYFQQLQSLPENRGKNMNDICRKAGFKNAQDYYQAEKERKEINRNKNKNKPVVRRYEDEAITDLDIKKKPEIQLRI